MTQKVINIIQGSSQCIDSVKSVPCDDYKARFEAFIRVKHGNIVINLVDWPTVATTINSTI